MRKGYLSLLVLILLTSCIPTRKTNYFQGEPQTDSEFYTRFDSPYKLQINDILSININSEDPEIVSLFSSGGDQQSSSRNGMSESALYFQGYQVDQHGNIRMPYIGEMNVLGYTEDEVREKIETELKKFIKSPNSFFVKVKISGIRFVVTGEVGRPGTITLQQNQVTIVEAIANAGEIQTYGNRQNVAIYRKTDEGVKRYLIDMTKVDVFDSENFYIMPNDVIYVEAMARKSWGFGATGFQTFTTFATILTVLVSTILLTQTL